MDYISDSGILYFVIAFFIIRHLWKAYINPAAVLGRQAANMNWVVSGRVEDEEGQESKAFTNGWNSGLLINNQQQTPSTFKTCTTSVLTGRVSCY